MLKIKEKIYNDIKTIYEYQLNTARYGYYRFMGTSKANELLHMVQVDNPSYKVCTSCGNGVLKMLKDINNAEILKEKKIDPQNAEAQVIEEEEAVNENKGKTPKKTKNKKITKNKKL